MDHLLVELDPANRPMFATCCYTIHRKVQRRKQKQPSTAEMASYLISRCTPTALAAESNGANCSCDGGWWRRSTPRVGKWRNIFLDTVATMNTWYNKKPKTEVTNGYIMKKCRNTPVILARSINSSTSWLDSLMLYTLTSVGLSDSPSNLNRTFCRISTKHHTYQIYFHNYVIRVPLHTQFAIN